MPARGLQKYYRALEMVSGEDLHNLQYLMIYIQYKQYSKEGISSSWCI